MLKRTAYSLPVYIRRPGSKRPPKSLLVIVTVALLLLWTGTHRHAEVEAPKPLDQRGSIVSKQVAHSFKGETISNDDAAGGDEQAHDSNADDADSDDLAQMAGDWQTHASPKQASEQQHTIQSSSHSGSDAEPAGFWPLSEAFPSFSNYSSLVSYAQSLPDVYHFSFEDAVRNDKLEGWEPDWIVSGEYDASKYGHLEEPRIDFVFTWVNGSDKAFMDTKEPYETNSTLNDKAGEWLASHSSNRYRDWDELRYSVRSVEANAPFRNRIQLLVNAVISKATGIVSKQIPSWLDTSSATSQVVHVLSQEDFFEDDKKGCLPTFNSLAIENQIHNIESNVDTVFAMSDDMLLGKPHAASDIYSPLFGPTMGFKTNAYSTRSRPTATDAMRFGEKPWLIYTSWLLNRRFGVRKRKGQAHFGHAMSRRVSKEAIASFPGPNVLSACSRFRGDFDFHLYSWYTTFHYTIERHREALLWSYLTLRSDVDQDGYLSPAEREQVLADLEEGMVNESKSSFRYRNFYHVADVLEAAGLESPKVNLDILWTSMDGPVTTKDIDCFSFDVNECLAPGFSILDDSNLGPYGGGPSHTSSRSPVFSTAAIFDRAARQQPECGDCLLKILLHRVQKGLAPLLPHRETQQREFLTVVKALVRYQYTVIDPDALFIMVTDAEQVESTLIKRFLVQGHSNSGAKRVGQLCLNDDVATEDDGELRDVHTAMIEFYEGLFPERSSFEKDPGA